LPDWKERVSLRWNLTDAANVKVREGWYAVWLEVAFVPRTHLHPLASKTPQPEKRVSRRQWIKRRWNSIVDVT